MHIPIGPLKPTLPQQDCQISQDSFNCMLPRYPGLLHSKHYCWMQLKTLRALSIIFPTNIMKQLLLSYLLSQLPGPDLL